MRHGEIKFVSEVLSGSQPGDSVRVLGRYPTHHGTCSHLSSPRLRQIDVASQVALIEHQSSSIRVDVSLLGNVAWQAGSLFSFIGEVDVEVLIVDAAGAYFYTTRSAGCNQAAQGASLPLHGRP